MSPSRSDRKRAVGRWIAVAIAALFTLGLLAEDADAQRRRRRRGKKRKPAPAKKAKGETEKAPTPDAGTVRDGPEDPEQADVVPGDQVEDGDAGDPRDAGAKVRTKGAKNKQTQVFDFTGLNLAGSERKPQLLYFLDRAQEELERASLERRSFVPEMVRSLDEESL